MCSCPEENTNTNPLAVLQGWRHSSTVYWTFWSLFCFIIIVVHMDAIFHSEHRFTTGFKSRDGDSHWKTSVFCSHNNFFVGLLVWVFKVCNTCKMFYIHGGFHANEYYLSVTMLSLYFYNLGTLKILPYSPHSPSTKPFCCVYLICIYCSATLSPSNFWNTCCQLRPLLSVTSVVSHQGLGECYCILMYTCTWLEWQ